MIFPQAVAARRQRRDALTSEPLEVLVIGGGISGAPVFAELARAGMRVGLLYLNHSDPATVRKLCMAPNRLLF